MRLLPALALSGAVVLGACTNPDGTVDVPATLALGAGAAIAGLAIASAANPPRYTNNNYYYGRPAYRYGRPAYGYGRPYRRW
ncbi:hypothetical protein [Roseomonas sp. AR75]|uniref:hypothetical protein n=1 Tax=Roseomonas sp. AR75 TaxID=2562311 RepID=UPI0010C0E880|nr:hypothetical protein [Roseomonas sp. AR75]